MEPFAELGCILKVDVCCDACKMETVNILSSICGVYSVTIESDEARIYGEVDPNLLLRALSKSGRGNHAEVKWVTLKHPLLSNSHMADGYRSNSNPLLSNSHMADGYGSNSHMADGYGSYNNHGYGSNSHGYGYSSYSRDHGYSSISGPFRQRRSLPEYTSGYEGHQNHQYPFRSIAPDYSYASNYYSGALPPPRYVSTYEDDNFNSCTTM